MLRHGSVEMVHGDCFEVNRGIGGQGEQGRGGLGGDDWIPSYLPFFQQVRLPGMGGGTEPERTEVVSAPEN
jgi:hypothetical protein